MYKILNSLRRSKHLVQTPHTAFTVLLELVMNQSFTKHRNFKYIHGLLQYGVWQPTTDIFCNIEEIYLKAIQNKQAFFIFDATTEGFSPIYHLPLFDMLYFNCEKYNIDPKQIIYASSNLKDENNIKIYSELKKVIPINVFSYPAFENAILKTEARFIENTLNQIISQTNAKHKDKYFSSLSRVNRDYRTAATFLLFNSDLKDKALISHDVWKTISPQGWLNSLNLIEYNEKDVKTFCKNLPLIVDRTDFKKNWAINTDFKDIYNQTLFQIANETEVNNYNNTALFYSEKTFKPISQMQPFVIYGQQGANKYLKELGYKIYDDWFDLDFDDESDNIIRYKKLLESVRKVCKDLDNMNKNQRIEWRFKNKELLLHNYYTMATQEYSKKKIKDFLENLFEEHK